MDMLEFVVFHQRAHKPQIGFKLFLKLGEEGKYDENMLQINFKRTKNKTKILKY